MIMAPMLTYIRDGSFSIVWMPNVVIFLLGHVGYLYALYLVIWMEIPVGTYVYAFWLTNWAGLGIGSGAHRLWAHKSYEASLPLKIFLMIGQLIAGQNSLRVWVRDHRLHHKFSDTDADPHNVRRGFFFAHVGWLMRRKHPDVKKKGSGIDLTDLDSDPIVNFQTRHYWILYILFAFLIPIGLPVYCWSDSWTNSLFICYFLRYVTGLHCTWFVNSTAHMIGDRPYDRTISPTDNNWVSFCTFGEGYHNYHHSFPWDYATSELPFVFNVNKRFIELMARLGWASNLKRPSRQLVDSVKRRNVTLTLMTTSGRPTGEESSKSL